MVVMEILVQKSVRCILSKGRGIWLVTKIFDGGSATCDSLRQSGEGVKFG